jgi:signal transduction histidine kinase
MEVRPFTDKQIGLLETFADQAVIAIENTRLFRELEERTRELARSVEELRALGEVGQAVSSSLDLPEVLRERAGRHGIALGLEIDRDLDLIAADERKVKQVVFNLLSNAVKFTPDGGRVDLSARLVDHEVQVAVRDTGIGIAPEDRAYVFDEFRQVGQGTAKSEGTGLGLALTKRFIELHGGRIRVESEGGVGTTFTFTLPLKRPESPGSEAVRKVGSPGGSGSV